MPADAIAGNLYRQVFHTSSASDVFLPPVASSTPSGGTWTPAIANLGGGNYEFSYTFTSPGVYTIELQGSVSGQAFTGTFEILAQPGFTLPDEQPGSVIQSTRWDTLVAQVGKLSL
jgi:hypothetical protein